MGDPKRQRKKFDTPRFPWQMDTLEAELKLLGQYGLRNKREIWRHKTLLSKYRGIGRSLLGKSVEERSLQEEQLLNRLNRLGILNEESALDDVLAGSSGKSGYDYFGIMACNVKEPPSGIWALEHFSLGPVIETHKAGVSHGY